MDCSVDLYSKWCRSWDRDVVNSHWLIIHVLFNPLKHLLYFPLNRLTNGQDARHKQRLGQQHVNRQSHLSTAIHCLDKDEDEMESFSCLMWITTGSLNCCVHQIVDSGSRLEAQVSTIIISNLDHFKINFVYFYKPTLHNRHTNNTQQKDVAEERDPECECEFRDGLESRTV